MTTITFKQLNIILLKELKYTNKLTHYRHIKMILVDTNAVNSGHLWHKPQWVTLTLIHLLSTVYHTLLQLTDLHEDLVYFVWSKNLW